MKIRNFKSKNKKKEQINLTEKEAIQIVLDAKKEIPLRGNLRDLMKKFK